MGDLGNPPSSTTSHPQPLFYHRCSSVVKAAIILFLGFSPLTVPETPDLFRFQIGFVKTRIEVRCCSGYIHYASVISDVVNMSMIDGQSLWSLKTVLGTLIPKLEKRYRNRTFIFLLVMEDNPKEKLYDEIMVIRYLWPLKYATEDLDASGRRRLISTKEESCQFYFSIQYIWYRKSESLLKLWKPPWKRRRFKANGTPFLLYGDVLRIVEDWQSQFLFISKESIHWVQNQIIFLDPNWELVNVIQQKKLCTILSILRVLRHMFCSFIRVIEDDNRLKTNVWKAYGRKRLPRFHFFVVLSSSFRCVFGCNFINLCIFYVILHSVQY